jgi:hypothetical protein
VVDANVAYKMMMDDQSLSCEKMNQRNEKYFWRSWEVTKMADKLIILLPLIEPLSVDKYNDVRTTLQPSSVVFCFLELMALSEDKGASLMVNVVLG